jgi:hypothetical protein
LPPQAFIWFWLKLKHELPPLQPPLPLLLLFLLTSASCIGTTPNATESIATAIKIATVAIVELFTYLFWSMSVIIYILRKNLLNFFNYI